MKKLRCWTKKFLKKRKWAKIKATKLKRQRWQEFNARQTAVQKKVWFVNATLHNLVPIASLCITNSKPKQNKTTYNILSHTSLKSSPTRILEMYVQANEQCGHAQRQERTPSVGNEVSVCKINMWLNACQTLHRAQCMWLKVWTMLQCDDQQQNEQEEMQMQMQTQSQLVAQ